MKSGKFVAVQQSSGYGTRRSPKVLFGTFAGPSEGAVWNKCLKMCSPDSSSNIDIRPDCTKQTIPQCFTITRLKHCPHVAVKHPPPTHHSWYHRRISAIVAGNCLEYANSKTIFVTNCLHSLHVCASFFVIVSACVCCSKHDPQSQRLVSYRRALAFIQAMQHRSFSLD